MLKHWFNRLAHIASGSFGLGKGEGFGLEASLTKFERFFHFWVLVGRSFTRNRCPVRASALSFNTLLALIPMLAVSMSITSVFLKSTGEEQIKMFIEQLVDRIAPTGQLPSASTNQIVPPESEVAVTPTPTASGSNDVSAVGAELLATTNFNTAVVKTLPEGIGPLVEPSAAASQQKMKRTVAQDAANYIYQFAKRSYSGTLGITGMFFLALTAIMTLTRVEETFNDIWGVTRGRDWWARITNYFFTIALGPGMIIVALGLMSGPSFQKSREWIGFVPLLQPVLTSLLPVAIICLTFTLLYKLVPNTKVDFSAALVGGTLAGLAWNGYNHLGFLLASRAVSASAVYGSLFMVPLLMGGLYVVWLTVLFGAQVAYAFQNRASYLQEQLAENVNQRGREFVALRLMTCIGQRFDGGRPPATIREISAELGIPSKLVQQVLRTLLAAGLVVEVNGKESAYTPARPLERINCHHILTAMRATNGQEPATRDEPVRVEVLGEFARIQAAERDAAASVTMLALVQRARMRLELTSGSRPESVSTWNETIRVDSETEAAAGAATNTVDVATSQPVKLESPPEICAAPATPQKTPPPKPSHSGATGDTKISV